jgi:hypothetical protein
MKPWPKRIRNLTLAGVLLAGAVCIAAVVTAPWVEQSASDISQQQKTTMQKEIVPRHAVSGSTAKTEKARIEDRERPVDVF